MNDTTLFCYHGVMRKLALILVIFVAAIATSTNLPVEAETECEPEFTVYLPVIKANDGRPTLGMAWTPQSYVADAKADFGDAPYYHSNSWQKKYWADGGIPVLRTAHDDREGFERVLMYLEWRGYEGDVKLFNECDRTGQDDCTPQEGAVLYRRAVQVLPNARFIVGNSAFLPWLDAFLEEVSPDFRAGVDIIGWHHYNTGEWLPANMMLPSQKQAALFDILDRHGLPHDNMLMETGTHRFKWSPLDMFIYYDDMLSLDSEAVFVFSTWCSYPAPYECPHDLYDADHELNDNGWALREAWTRGGVGWALR